MSESKGLPEVIDIPSLIANDLISEFVQNVLQPLDVVNVDTVDGLGTTRPVVQNLPNAKKSSGDLDLLMVANKDSRQSVKELVEWAKSKNYDYQVAFGNIFSVAYPYGGNKYQIDLMISQPSEDNQIYDYMRKFKYFADEDPNQSGDFILKGAHRSELAKTIVKAMGLSAAENGFKQFKWNGKYNDISEIVELLEKKNKRFRDTDKKEQIIQLVDLLNNEIKDIGTLKKHLVDNNDLLKNRYPTSVFKNLSKAFNVMVDVLFVKENTPESWETVLDQKFQTPNTIENMKTFDSVMGLVQTLLDKQIVTSHSVLNVFTEMKKSFDTGKAAGRWNRSLEEYIEKQFPFLKNKW